MLSTKQGRIRADFAKIQARFKEFHEKYKTSEQKMSDIWKAQSERFRQFWQTKMMNDQLETIPQSDLIPIAQILNESVQRKTPEEKDVTPIARTGMTSDNILSALKNIHADKAIRSKIDDLLKSEDPKRQAELITQIYDMNKGKRNYITGDNAVFLNDLLFAFSPEKNLRVLSMEHRYRLMDYLGIEKGEIDSMSIGEKVIDSRQKLLEFKDKLGPDITTWEYSNFLYSKPLNLNGNPR